jgi:phytoene synthase
MFSMEQKYMSVHGSGWEAQLLAWAYEALHSPVLHAQRQANQADLAEAYQYCLKITQENSRTFFMASSLLSPAKRQAAHALYAFCRVTDDIVDKATGDKDPMLALAAWRQWANNPFPPSDEPVLVAWADAQARFSIPKGYADQLIDGIARDLTTTRYATFDDLAAYCYGVASTVGLMTMHLIGFASPDAIPYAVKLGVALQLTNILRDVGEDWRSGRVYLPQDELARFNLSEDDLARGVVSEAWRDFMRFQIERTNRFYAEAQTGIAMLNRDGRFAIQAASTLYQAILRDIETHDYDVFTRRAYVPTLGKVRRLPLIWWKAFQR